MITDDSFSAGNRSLDFLPDAVHACSTLQRFREQVVYRDLRIKLKRTRKTVIRLEVTIALDRANDRTATLCIAVRNLWLNNDDFNVNRFSVKRDRERTRSLPVIMLRQQFGKSSVYIGTVN